jgi:hypothetical protein
MVDVAQSSLVTSATDTVLAVRTAVQTAIQFNSTLLYAVFSPVTLSACSAQGIAAQVCPSPSSLVLTGASTAASVQEPSSVLVPSIAGGIVGLLVVAAVVAALWRRAKSSPKVKPGASTGLTIRHVNHEQARNGQRP